MTMKLEEIRIPAADGLEDNHFTRLGDVVVLAGPNGSGKSRLLDRVRQITTGHGETQHRSNLNQMRQLHKRLVELRRSNAHATELEVIENGIKGLEEQHGSFSPFGNPKVVMFEVATQLPTSSGNLGVNDLRQSFESWASTFGPQSSGLYATLHQVSHAYRITRTPEHGDDPEYVKLTKSRYEKLRGTIELFLGKAAEFRFDAEKGPMLFGLPLDKAKLSPGQRILLEIATTLAIQDGDAEDLIVMLDEPENHLHPEAIVDVLDQLIAKATRAQLWIATHSVHVIARFEEKALWVVKNGKATRAGRDYQAVLESLVGGRESVEKLSAFLDRPAELGLRQFAVQCLAEPRVADTRPGDAQTVHTRDALLKAAPANTKVAVLDFGMGYGRLLSELAASPAKERFEYYGWDHEAAKDDLRQQSIARIDDFHPGQGVHRYFTGFEQLQPLAGLIDAVVLCNALHEIPVEDWASKLFGPNGAITSVLKPTGHLYVVEDQILAVGEHAHECGFLVLDQDELRALFATASVEATIVTIPHKAEALKNRVKAHRIAQPVLKNCTKATVASAVSRLQESAMERAREISTQRRTLAFGREYCFWTQQHFNATRAIAVLAKVTSDA